MKRNTSTSRKDGHRSGRLHVMRFGASRLMNVKIMILCGCDAMQSGRKVPTFHRNLSEKLAKQGKMECYVM